MASFRNRGLVRKSLMRRLIIFFLLVALIPTVAVGVLSFRSQQQALELAEYKRLDEARQLRMKEISTYLHQTLTNVKFLATTPAALEALNRT